MASIGSFGNVKFRVQRKKNGRLIIRSFKNFTAHFSANYGEHPRQGKKPYLEFDGLNAREYAITIFTSLDYGFDPVSTKKKLYKYFENGTPNYLIVNNIKLCKNKLVITDFSESRTEFLPNGRRRSITFELQLKEYLNRKKKEKKKKSKKNTKKTASSKTAKNTGYTRYTTKDGDTLWLLAVKFYKNGNKYKKIYNANKNTIKNPNVLKAGMILKIPK